jgi:hypothetical protein
MENDTIIQEETSITEISIAPDGRIFIFGLSRPILEMCAELNPSSQDMQQRIECLRDKDDGRMKA